MFFFFFFKQKTAYEMRISDWSSDVCYSDLSPEVQYMQERRKSLGGYLPQRRRKSTESLPVPPLQAYERLLKSTGEREISTTMAFVQMLKIGRATCRERVCQYV